MSINQERLQEMIDIIYHMKEEFEVQDNSVYDDAYELVDQLQTELENILNDMI